MTPDPADSSTLTTPGASAVDERHLSADLSMDAVTLRVGDLETMSSYYENALALSPLEETARATGEVHRVLGRGGVPFVRLVSTPGLPAVDPRQAGLFHTAFLFEDQASLAGTVLRAAQDPRSRFAGTGDHLVCRGAGPVPPPWVWPTWASPSRPARTSTLSRPGYAPPASSSPTTAARSLSPIPGAPP